MPDSAAPALSETTIETPASKADAAIDAALTNAGYSTDESPRSLAPAESKETTAPQRDSQGRFVSTKEEASGGEATDGQSAAVESKYSDDDVRKAVKAAQRYKAPKSVLKAIESGDEDAMSYALNLAKIQDDNDSYTTKQKTLQQELDSLKSAKQNDAKGDTATATAPEVESLAAHLAELTGDEKTGEIVRKSLAGQTKPLTSELEKANQQIATLQKQVEDMAIERARDALISEYPDLKEKGVWSKVKAAYDELPISESRPDTLTRLEHAARIELAPELAKRARDERDRRNKVRDQGQPTPPDRAGETAAPNTHGSLQDQLLDAMEKKDENRVKEIKAEIQQRLKR